MGQCILGPVAFPPGLKTRGSNWQEPPGFSQGGNARAEDPMSQ